MIWVPNVCHPGHTQVFRDSDGLAGTTRQPIFSVILSRLIYLSIYLSIYLCLSAELQTAARLRIAYNVYGETAGVYVIYFPANCAGVTNKSSRDNLSHVKIYRVIADIGV